MERNMRYKSKLTAKGQTTIPLEVRKALGIGSGDVIGYEIVGDAVKLVKKRRALEFAGILHDPDRRPLTLDEMKAWPDAAIERYADAEDDRD